MTDSQAAPLRWDTVAFPRDLIEAKLQVPRRRATTVRRTRLLRRLRSAGDRRAVSIVAPPGFGKTSLLVQWASRAPGAVAWLTVDDDDNDPVVFLTYLAAAIDRVEPLDRGIYAAIVSPAVTERAVIGRLLAGLARRSAPLLIALDDAHRLTDRTSLDALAELVTYLPDGYQVAIAGREPPALPYSRWRAEGSLLEIGPADLAMDEEEAARLGHELGPDLAAGQMAELARRAEGWPALLALLALQAGRSARGGAPVESGRDRVIADYLSSELLAGRPDAEIAFLTRTSILEHLSGPVCDALVDERGSTRVLENLANSTLLVDEYGGSYRYHTLLRDFLRSELEVREPAQVAPLHRRAAAWYQANGALELAVEHAFAAGDRELAALLVGRGMLAYHWTGRRATMRAWFGRFDDDELAGRPWLAVLAAWEEGAAGEVARALRLADIAERATFSQRPPDGTATFESGRAMLRASLARRGAADALENATAAVELESPDSGWLDFALWQLAIARRMLGDHAGADAAAAAGIDVARTARHAGLLYCLRGYRALLALERGDASSGAEWLTAGTEPDGPAFVDGYLSSIPARAARITIAIGRGQVEDARRDLALATGLRPLLTAAAPAVSVQCLLAFARAHLAVGDPAGARTSLTQASQVIHERPDLGDLPREVAAMRASLASLPIGVAGGATSLTAAELRVLALLPYYLSFKEVGARLGVKATTVKTHALAIYGKLGASSRSEAIDVAVEAGLLERFPNLPSGSAIAEDATDRRR